MTARAGKAPLLVLTVLVFLIGVAVVLLAPRQTATAVPHGGGELPRSAAIEQRFGIRFTGAYLIADGGMIEVQYQVLDADKAQALGAEDTSPIIVSGGRRFDTPGLAGHGHFHPNAVAGRRAFVLLANSGGALHGGDRVSVRVDDLALDDVILE